MSSAWLQVTGVLPLSDNRQDDGQPATSWLIRFTASVNHGLCMHLPDTWCRHSKTSPDQNTDFWQTSWQTWLGWPGSSDNTSIQAVAQKPLAYRRQLSQFKKYDSTFKNQQYPITQRVSPASRDSLAVPLYGWVTASRRPLVATATRRRGANSAQRQRARERERARDQVITLKQELYQRKQYSLPTFDTHSVYFKCVSRNDESRTHHSHSLKNKHTASESNSSSTRIPHRTTQQTDNKTNRPHDEREAVREWMSESDGEW